jgi:hypothetical protein
MCSGSVSGALSLLTVLIVKRLGSALELLLSLHSSWREDFFVCDSSLMEEVLHEFLAFGVVVISAFTWCFVAAHQIVESAAATVLGRRGGMLSFAEVWLHAVAFDPFEAKGLFYAA